MCRLCWNVRRDSECMHLVLVCVEIRMHPHALCKHTTYTYVHTCAMHWTCLIAEHIHFYRPLLYGVSQHTLDSPYIRSRYLFAVLTDFAA